MKGLRCASIRKQLVFLAILLVVLVSAVAATTEPFIYGRHDKGIEIGLFAGRIETILERFARARTSTDEEEALQFADRMGVSTQRVETSRATISYKDGMPNPEILHQVKRLINDGIVTAISAAFSGNSDPSVLIVKLDSARALAFSMPQFPASVWLAPAMASGILKIVIPLVLLALLGSWLITEPLVRFANTAQRVSMDDHSEEPFKAEGASEIRSLAASLNVMQGRIQTMLRERTRVLRAISHDLRTPLTRLRMRIDRSNEPALKEMMLADVAMLSSLIDASLSFLDNKFEPARKVDLSSLLQTISDDFADTGISIRFIGPRRLKFICMPQGLTRAISNLIDNASRYANSIEIELEDSSQAVIIKVSDDGPGLPDDLKQKVLEPFFKADESRQTGAKSGGFGLGLSIAQGIVTVGHKGLFRLQDRLPNGLVVEMILPKTEATSVSRLPDV
ncbi:HAMP domain-containing protein [Agrobacterium sp. Ap1]|uniref:ATP-binding protein n=1 Tax=Agrobacterium sp. Ap1 TaxID=2815337 RepID=UPI001A8CFB45|nr:ATP-binding protein [Agrobacterium sp. Ap1]MBO0144648.1 HAMP domain-containing protein [Agrobacterium sp. Ap1]